MAGLQLKSEVAAKYDLVGVKPGEYEFAGFGRIDLCGMSLAFADRLHNAGAPFLRLKQTRTPAKKRAKS